MRWTALFALFALLAAVGTDPSTPSEQGVEAIAQAGAANASIKSYTFDIAVHVVMHSFPWLRFGLSGNGLYERDGKHTVHFAHVPWFGKGFETISLDALDPPTWPKTYAIDSVDRTGDQAMLTMHDRKPNSGVAKVEATLENASGVREIQWIYHNGGTITVVMTPADVSGHALPSHDQAEIRVSGISASASADFTNYHVVDDGPGDPTR